MAGMSPRSGGASSAAIWPHAQGAPAAEAPAGLTLACSLQGQSVAVDGSSDTSTYVKNDAGGRALHRPSNHVQHEPPRPEPMHLTSEQTQQPCRTPGTHLRCVLHLGKVVDEFTSAETKTTQTWGFGTSATKTWRYPTAVENAYAASSHVNVRDPGDTSRSFSEALGSVPFHPHPSLFHSADLDPSTCCLSPQTGLQGGPYSQPRQDAKDGYGASHAEALLEPGLLPQVHAAADSQSHSDGNGHHLRHHWSLHSRALSKPDSERSSSLQKQANQDCEIPQRVSCQQQQIYFAKPQDQSKGHDSHGLQPCQRQQHTCDGNLRQHEHDSLYHLLQQARLQEPPASTTQATEGPLPWEQSPRAEMFCSSERVPQAVQDASQKDFPGKGPGIQVEQRSAEDCKAGKSSAGADEKPSQRSGEYEQGFLSPLRPMGTGVSVGDSDEYVRTKGLKHLFLEDGPMQNPGRGKVVASKIGSNVKGTKKYSGGVADKSLQKKSQTKWTTFFGVRWRRHGMWAAEILHPCHSRRIWLGSFDTADEAARAYDFAARILSYPINQLNFPKDVQPVRLKPKALQELQTAAKQKFSNEQELQGKCKELLSYPTAHHSREPQSAFSVSFQGDHNVPGEHAVSTSEVASGDKIQPEDRLIIGELASKCSNLDFKESWSPSHANLDNADSNGDWELPQELSAPVIYIGPLLNENSLDLDNAALELPQ